MSMSRLPGTVIATSQGRHGTRPMQAGPWRVLSNVLSTVDAFSGSPASAHKPASQSPRTPALGGDRLAVEQRPARPALGAPRCPGRTHQPPNAVDGATLHSRPKAMTGVDRSAATPPQLIHHISGSSGATESTDAPCTRKPVRGQLAGAG